MTEDDRLMDKDLIWHPGTGQVSAAQLAAMHTRHANAIRPIPSGTVLGHEHLMADADRGALLADLNRAMEEGVRLEKERDGFRNMMNSAVSAGVVMDGERLDALREVERLQGIVDAALTLHPAVANTELESAQDITTGMWVQPAQICGTCHVFNGPYDPCSRYMWPCPEARLLLGQEGAEKFVCQGEWCPGWKDSGICPQGLRHW